MDPIFQFTDLSTHVQNCSNDECILPTCVNEKLNVVKNCHKQPQQHKNREWSTTVSDARHKREKLRLDKELDETTALFFEDLEEFIERDLGKWAPSCLATETDAKNSFYVSQNDPGCNQLHIGVDDDVKLTLNSQQNKNYEFAQFPLDKLAMVLTGISPDESKARSLETQFFPSELDKFTRAPIDFSDRRHTSRTTATMATTQATDKLTIFCALQNKKHPHEDESKLKKGAPIIQPGNAKTLLGILAQILQMIEEGLVSQDSEAFCVEVLQKALTELQVRFSLSELKKNPNK
ncbi:uncharacterized protein LOC122954284 [Acropora millepora]|uniref:uncharacterized protein LOC122954284 n=1 Tax=Acropora millepora TaxID=45264 RepID=UPI001CF44875|nr:uncharacterized protein LOC122954284 [Acropora millepora]